MTKNFLLTLFALASLSLSSSVYGDETFLKCQQKCWKARQACPSGDVNACQTTMINCENECKSKLSS